MSLITFGVLLWWQWPLAVALVAGIVATAIGLFWQEPGGRALRAFMAELWHSDTSGVLKAIVVGAIALVCSFALGSAWAASSDRWLVTGIWVQAIATLSVLAVLVGEVGRRQQERSQRVFDSLLRDMGSPSALRRLAAARNWQRHFPIAPANLHQTRLGVDYLRMVLEREVVPEVREALLDNLEAWGFNPNLSDATPADAGVGIADDGLDAVTPV